MNGRIKSCHKKKIICEIPLLMNENLQIKKNKRMVLNHIKKRRCMQRLISVFMEENYFKLVSITDIPTFLFSPVMGVTILIVLSFFTTEFTPG